MAECGYKGSLGTPCWYEAQWNGKCYFHDKVSTEHAFERTLCFHMKHEILYESVRYTRRVLDGYYVKSTIDRHAEYNWVSLS